MESKNWRNCSEEIINGEIEAEDIVNGGMET